jgi:hypothetical protein
MKFGDAKVDPYISIEGPTDKASRTAPKSPVTKPSHFATTDVSDAERIAAAKARNLASVRENNLPGAQYSFEYRPEYFKDGCGVETSVWYASVLVCMAEILEAPILKRSRWVWTHDKYDPRTGNFNLSDTPAVTIAELKSAVDTRIAELDLSKVLIWEWYCEPHGLGTEWWRQTLSERLSVFRRSEV